MHSTLGIYFGIKYIEIIETKKKKIINNIHISHEIVSEGELVERVPEEVKLVALIKNELRTARIEAKDVTIALPGNDLVIRTFDMGLLPREELLTAVFFEAKKYIPFKTEDLVCDYKIKLDRKNKKNLVLFFSIKRDMLDKYISVAQQLGLNIINIEYSGFSLLRLLDLIGIKKRGVFGIIDIDLEEETNFTILEDYFPLFSRDINLAYEPGKEAPAAETGMSYQFQEKLKSEIRISLDYYRRKFPTKDMRKLVVVANEAYKNDIEAMGKELGLSMVFVDLFKYILGQEIKFGLGSIKAYSASLGGFIKTPLKLDLLASRERAKELKGSETELGLVIPVLPLRIDYRFVAIGLFIIFFFFSLVLYKKLPLEKEIKDLLNNRAKLETLKGDKSYEELKTLNTSYTEKINSLDSIIKKQVYLAEELNVIPSVLPEGAWLTSLSFRQGENDVELTIKGQIFLGDRSKEFEAANEIFSNLKANTIFSNTFRNIDITSLDRTKAQDYEVTSFVILCKSKKI